MSDNPRDPWSNDPDRTTRHWRPVTITLTGLDGPVGRLSRADMGAAARRALPFPTIGAPYGGLQVHEPTSDPRTFLPGDIVTDVQTGESGTVTQDFGNGIARVQWHDRKRRDGRRLVPLVTDIGTVRLCA